MTNNSPACSRTPSRLRPSHGVALLALVAATFGLGASAQAQAQTDMQIYTDAPLTGGWQDWSWANVNVASTAVVYAGSTSISVAAGPWQALSLEHAAFSTAGYGNLTFWINGGSNGQQQLFVVPTENNVNDPGVTIGPIAANAWQQISLPLTALGVANVTDFTGFWIQEGTGTDQSQNPFYVDNIVLTGSVPILPAPPLNGGMAIYDDNFVSGWANWSWATVNPANTSPVNSGTSSIAVTAGPWQALSFHHSDINTQSYASITFWINGGSTGGQVLQLHALLDGTAQAGVPVGPLVANTWQKIVIPLASLGAANQPNLSDFWLQESQGLSDPTFYVDDIRLDVAPPPAVVNVTIDATNRLRHVDPRTFGVNAAVWDSVSDTPTTVGLLNEIQNQVLRFPGGSTADDYHWQTNTSEGQTSAWATSFDAFANTATLTQADAFITANYGTGTPQEAAAWVRYSNVKQGYGFKYWEIGNEIYGTWEADNNTLPHDPVTYASFS